MNAPLELNNWHHSQTPSRILFPQSHPFIPLVRTCTRWQYGGQAFDCLLAYLSYFFASALKHHTVREFVHRPRLCGEIQALLWNYDLINASILRRRHSSPTDGSSLNHKIITSQKLEEETHCTHTHSNHERVKHICSLTTPDVGIFVTKMNFICNHIKPDIREQPYKYAISVSSFWAFRSLCSTACYKADAGLRCIDISRIAFVDMKCNFCPFQNVSFSVMCMSLWSLSSLMG